MIDVPLFFVGVSVILFLGFLAEFMFKKTHLPDVLFLLILGFFIGSYGLGYVTPESLAPIAPVFTTFTLVFLLFDGAFNIRLVSLLKEFAPSLWVTGYNFVLSVITVAIISSLAGLPWVLAIVTGFILGGTSSAFVIPVLRKLKVKQKLYSLLTFESALTDVLCIVFSLTMFEIIQQGSFSIQSTLTILANLFVTAAGMGLLGGIIWFILTVKIFKEHNYLVTIAYLLLLYVITEFLGGNGPIAALFFGLFLKNSRQISSIVKGIMTRNNHDKKNAVQGDLGISVVTPMEESFYHQISFVLKTFFFVYIGVLIDFSNPKALLIGGVISIALLIVRKANSLITKNFAIKDRALINSIFARGLAAAAITQVAVFYHVPQVEFISQVVYIVIAGTIILSSVRIFAVFTNITYIGSRKPKVFKPRNYS